MTRVFSEYASHEARKLLSELIRGSNSTEYQQTMYELGSSLAQIVSKELKPAQSVLLICTNEDADFLASGVLNSLQESGVRKISLACFWNDRKKITLKDGTLFDVSPIIKRYVEPAENVDVFVVVKSIISSACVVRTNITEMVYDKAPKQIYVVSPVMHSNARAGLSQEFDKDISSRFKFIYFAEDSVRKEDGEIVPGIGGSVYELLGIGTKETKNKYIPRLVRQRRSQMYANAS